MQNSCNRVVRIKSGIHLRQNATEDKEDCGSPRRYRVGKDSLLHEGYVLSSRLAIQSFLQKPHLPDRFEDAPQVLTR